MGTIIQVEKQEGFSYILYKTFKVYKMCLFIYNLIITIKEN